MWFLVYVLPKYVLYKLFMVAQEYLRALPHLCNKTLFQASVLEPDGAPQNVRGQNSSSTSILVMGMKFQLIDKMVSSRVTPLLTSHKQKMTMEMSKQMAPFVKGN